MTECKTNIDEDRHRPLFFFKERVKKFTGDGEGLQARWRLCMQDRASNVFAVLGLCKMKPKADTTHQHFAIKKRKAVDDFMCQVALMLKINL